MTATRNITHEYANKLVMSDKKKYIYVCMHDQDYKPYAVHKQLI